MNTDKLDESVISVEPVPLSGVMTVYQRRRSAAIAAPPTGPAGNDLQLAYCADVQLAIASGQASTLPSCTSVTAGLSLTTPSPSSIIVTDDVIFSYVSAETPATQTMNQYVITTNTFPTTQTFEIGGHDIQRPARARIDRTGHGGFNVGSRRPRFRK